MDTHAAQRFIDDIWQDSIYPELVEYIKIPNKSPHFDPNWADHGYMEDAVSLIESWCRRQNIPGMTLDIIRLEGRTPLIFMDIPGANNDDCLLLYGHLDKQPEMSGWADDLGPWQPVLKDDKLYGRGGADDGYAAFASLAALLAVQHQQLPHSRCVVIIEACEESGSYDLPFYIDALRARIGTPSLVICLDSSAGNYDQLWLTTSLRGLTGGTLRVEVLDEGIHSGYSGIAPSSFRILRQVLDKLEDSASGRLLVDELHAQIPPQRLQQTRMMAALLGAKVHRNLPFSAGVKPMDESPLELLLNKNWRPALSLTGVDGIPPLASAGNVLRPQTSVKLSLRLPPTVDAGRAGQAVKQVLEQDPPYHAKVSFEVDEAASGWNSPDVASWLEQSLEAASQSVFGASAMYLGEGGTIPFMGMLGEQFPQAQFMITGVLGPKSNAHGPNEFLHLPYARKLTACTAKVIADHYQRS
jgi:acetylornithine deacetylase/succinyl-diaminopimelate desuccinylase-like protein